MVCCSSIAIPVDLFYIFLIVFFSAILNDMVGSPVSKLFLLQMLQTLYFPLLLDAFTNSLKSQIQVTFKTVNCSIQNKNVWVLNKCKKIFFEIISLRVKL